MTSLNNNEKLIMEPFDHLLTFIGAVMTQMKHLILSARFSPDGKRLLTGSKSGVLAEWDAASGQKLRGLLDPVDDEDRQDASFPPSDEKRQVSFPDGHPMETIRGYGIMAAGYSTGGGLLHAIAENGLAASWGAANGEALHAWRAHENDDGAVVMEASPDNRWLATGCRKFGTTTLRVWKVAENPLIPPVEAFSSDRMIGGVFSLAFSPDSRFLASGGWGNSGYSAPMIYDLATGERIGTLLYDVSRAICFSPDGKRLATGDEFGKVSVWDLASWKRVWENDAHGSIVSVVRFSADGRTLASGCSGGELKIWDAIQGGLRDESSYAGLILDCRFAPGDEILSIAIGCKGTDNPGIFEVQAR